MHKNFVIDNPDRTKPPAAGMPRDISFPKHFETVTANGITVIVIESYKIPAVSVRLVFKDSGSYYDSGKHGLASLTAELLTKGTSNRTAVQIAEEIDYLGGSLYTGADWDGSYLSLSCLKKHLLKAVDVLADVVFNPVFKDDEIDRIKEQRISGIIQGKDDTNVLADKLFNKVVFDGHPYSFPSEGTEHSIRELGYNDFSEFYRAHIKPQNLILAFVGAITIDEAMEIVNDRFANWKNNNKDIIINNNSFHSVYSPKNVYIANKKGAVQSSIRLGHIGIERNNPDLLAVTVMNTLLGGFFGSRINYVLREVHGFTYGARSGFNSRIQRGDFSVDTEVRTPVSYKAVMLILDELKKITESPVKDEELQMVKNYLTGVFPLQLETANAVASRVINLKLYDLPEDFYNNYISNINKLTRHDVLEAAQKYISPSNSYVVISGDAVSMKKDFETFGGVKIFDASMQPVTETSVS